MCTSDDPLLFGALAKNALRACGAVGARSGVTSNNSLKRFEFFPDHATGQMCGIACFTVGAILVLNGNDNNG